MEMLHMVRDLCKTVTAVWPWRGTTTVSECEDIKPPGHLKQFCLAGEAG